MVKKKVLKYAEAFSRESITAIITLHYWLEKNGYTIDDLEDYLEQVRVQKERADAWREKLKCPECNAVMKLYRVNHHPAAMVGGSWRSQVICPSCGYEDLSQRTVESRIEEIERTVRQKPGRRRGRKRPPRRHVRYYSSMRR